jgi:hypothetical protein
MSLISYSGYGLFQGVYGSNSSIVALGDGQMDSFHAIHVPIFDAAVLWALRPPQPVVNTALIDEALGCGVKRAREEEQQPLPHPAKRTRI